MSNEEVRTLKLGGQKAAVHVHERVEQLNDQNVSEGVAATVEKLYADYVKGAAWAKEDFAYKPGPDILAAIRLFCQRVNAEHAKANSLGYNPLELEEIVGKQVASLALPMQTLCRWTVLVRIGVRKLQRELLGLVSMVPMPPKGTVKMSRPADNVGKTHYVVCHLFGARFVCRGYSLSFNGDNRWVLGGPEGNKWFKDMWLTPGLQGIEALVGNRRRKTPTTKKLSEREASMLRRADDSLRSQLEKARAAAGMADKDFGAAHGARLDLENRQIMQSALSCVRAMIAQAVVAREDRIIDEIASRHDVSKSEVVENPALAEAEEESLCGHLARRTSAYQHFQPCGRFAIPHGYMVFAAQGVPSSIPESERVELNGVTGVAVSAKYLSTVPEDELSAYRRAPTALPEIEDLQPLIDACGVPSINGRTIDALTEICKDEMGMEVEDGVKYVRYSVDGQTTDMPKSEFQSKTMVRFVPMILDLRRRRLNVEDLQGFVDGVEYALSFDDVSERFSSCRNNSNRSNS